MARQVNIRCSLQDGEVVKRGLMALGPAGEEALKRIERGGQPASASLKLVDAASKETRSSLESLAARGGAASNVLRALGPVGLAAGVGLGAIVLGIGAVMAKAREAVGVFDDLQDAADRIGVGTEFLQGLKFSVGQAGGDIEKVEAALDKLNAVIGDVARGSGAEAEKTFKKLGVSVKDAEGNVKSLERFLPELADGYAKLTTASERASVAQDLFGRGNQAFARVLVDGADGLRRQIDLAREMGAVVDAELVRRGAEAKDKLEALAMVVSAQLNGAVVDAAPLIVKMGEAFAGLAHWVGMTADAWKDLPDQRVVTLTETLGKLRQQLAGLEATRADVAGSSLPSRTMTAELAGIDKLIAERRAEIQKFEQELNARRYGGLELNRGGAMANGTQVQELKGFSEAIQETIDKLKVQEDQARRAGRELAVYNALLGHENATAEERAAISSQAIKTFDAEDARRKREEQSRKDLAKATRDQQEADRKLQAQKREGERLTEQVASAEERRAIQLREINQLLEANAISEATAARAREKVEDQYLDDRTDFSSGFERFFRDVGNDAADTGAMVEDYLTSAFDHAGEAAQEFARTGKLSFSTLIDSMIQDSLRFLAQLGSSALFDVFSTIGGSLLKTGGGGSNPFAMITDGRAGRAAGGDAWPGQIYEVGERGREWFAPSVPGKVIPNTVVENMARGAGRGGFTFAPVNHNDFRGADSATVPRLQAMLDQRDRQWRQELPSLIRQHQAHSNI